jgi:hypothetical protein
MEQSNSIKFWYFDGNKRIEFPTNTCIKLKNLLDNNSFPVCITITNIVDDNKVAIPFENRIIKIRFTTPLNGVGSFTNSNTNNIIIESNWHQHIYFKNIIINKYISWYDITMYDFVDRLNNLLENCRKAISFFQNHTKQELKVKLMENISVRINNTDKFFGWNKKYFMKSNIAINLNVRPTLSGSHNWTPYINTNLNIWYNYVVYPSANYYRENTLHDYYMHMRSAIKLTLESMNTIGNIFVFNPIGMGAFMRRYNGDTNELKKTIIEILFDEYKSLQVKSKTKMILVMKGIITDIDFWNIHEKVFNKQNNKEIILTDGDMIDIAMNEKQKNTNDQIIITMAGDTFGPSNKCMYLPEFDKKGNAKTASDENNTRRSYEAIYMCLSLLLWEKYDDLNFKQFLLSDWTVVKQNEFSRYIYEQCKNRKCTINDNISAITQ